MIKRAEEAAMKAFPPKFTSPKRYAKRVQSEKVDTHATIRRFYQECYEQAEKDTIERAMNVLDKQIDDLIYSRLTIGDFLKQFRKRLEDE